MSLTSCDHALFQDCEPVLESQLVLDDVVDAATMHKPDDAMEARQEIQEYKHLLWVLRDENTQLKARLRRLEDILKKKNKIVDTHYLGTHNKLRFKEAMHQFTHRIESLQAENQDLKEELMEKDATIRKIRKQLNIYTAYKPQAINLDTNKKNKIPTSGSITSRGSDASRATLRARNAQERDDISHEMLKLKITEMSNNNNQESTDETDRAVSCSLLLETPHEEIEKLHTGFKEILSEVGKLKHSVGEIHEEHARVVHAMRMRGGLMHHSKFEASAAPRVGGDKGTSRRPASAFARLPPAGPQQRQRHEVSPKHAKKRNAFGIRTASKNSLHDETDMRLYIDEVLNDMNRNDFK